MVPVDPRTFNVLVHEGGWNTLVLETEEYSREGQTKDIYKENFFSDKK